MGFVPYHLRKASESRGGARTNSGFTETFRRRWVARVYSWSRALGKRFTEELYGFLADDPASRSLSIRSFPTDQSWSAYFMACEDDKLATCIEVAVAMVGQTYSEETSSLRQPVGSAEEFVAVINQDLANDAILFVVKLSTDSGLLHFRVEPFGEPFLVGGAVDGAHVLLLPGELASPRKDFDDAVVAWRNRDFRTAVERAYTAVEGTLKVLLGLGREDRTVGVALVERYFRERAPHPPEAADALRFLFDFLGQFVAIPAHKDARHGAQHHRVVTSAQAEATIYVVAITLVFLIRSRGGPTAT